MEEQEEHPESESEIVVTSPEVPAPEDQQPPAQPESTTSPRQFSKSSIKTAKKILTAVTKHRKTDAKDGKVETLQLTRKEKGKKSDGVTFQE